MGNQVTIIQMLPHLMKGLCTASRGYLIHHLEQAGVAPSIRSITDSISVGRVFGANKAGYAVGIAV